MRRRILASLTALAVVTGSTLAGALAEPLSAAADTDEVLAEWVLDFTVVQTYTDSASDREVTSAHYVSEIGGAMTWTGSYSKFLQTPAGEACGTNEYREEGSGSGSGALRLGSGGFAASAFGLDPAADWTAIVPYTEETFPTSWTNANGCFSSSGNSAKIARVGPVFLPGSPDDLGVLPPGTVLTGSYTATDAYGPGPLTITYTATKAGEVDDNDSDGDGVADESDQCPGTPIGDTVDANGCTVQQDSDGDGVPDDSDQCPGTPGGVSVDVFGCPVDSDGDGVPDGLDLCAGTPSGAAVDADGCSLDEDSDGVPDGIDQCSGTPAGFPIDADGCALDSDGDGVYDGADVCADTPAGASVDANGCHEGAGYCNTSAQARGYTLAHYDADMNVRLLPDPDFFDWEVSATWCVVNNEVYFGGVDSHGAVTLGLTAATALDLVGVTFRYDLEDESSFVRANQGATTGSVVASADFDVCVRPLDLLLAGGGLKKVEKALNDSASSILGKMPKNGDSAFSQGGMAARAEDAVDDSIRAIADGIAGATDPKNLNKATGRTLASGVWDRVAGIAESELSDPHVLFDVLQARQNLAEIADEKWQRFLGAYSNDGRITIPPGQMKSARDLWDQLNTDLALASAQSLYNMIADVTWCGTVWHPTLTLYVPHPGESFVDAGDVDGSIFDVKGGVTIDARSGE